MKLTYILLISLILYSCSEKPYVCNCDTSAVAKNDSILQSEGTITNLPKFLARYNQESLTEEPEESYRLLTMHAFNRYYQVYTITKTESGAEFSIQEFLCSQAYAGDGKLSNEHHSTLTSDEWKSFKRIINENCFWTISFEDPSEGQYIDGGEWYIEGFQPNKRNCTNSDYLITMRQLPSKQKRFYMIYKAIMGFVDPKQIHTID